MSMSAEDWLDMPERNDNVQCVQLLDSELKLYEEFENEQYLEFLQGSITAALPEQLFD